MVWCRIRSSLISIRKQQLWNGRPGGHSDLNERDLIGGDELGFIVKVKYFLCYLSRGRYSDISFLLHIKVEDLRSLKLLCSHRCIIVTGSVADIAWVTSIFNRHHVSKSTAVNINLVRLKSYSLTNQREQKQLNQSNRWFWNICPVNVFHYPNHTGPRPIAQISGTRTSSMVCGKGRPVKRTFTVLIEDDEQRIRFLHIFVDTYTYTRTHTDTYIPVYICIYV